MAFKAATCAAFAMLLLVPLLLSPAVSAAQLKAQVTPVQKVIELLGRLTHQLEEEGAKEAAEYDKFACFCKDQMAFKTAQIEKSEEKISVLSAKIEQLTTKITELDGEVSELGKRITALEGEIKTEKETRKADLEKYLVKDKDVTEAIDAVEEAIEMMKTSKSKMNSDADLDLSQLKKVVGKEIALLVVAQKPNAYVYRSNDIIATLEGLKDTFKAEKKQQDEDEFGAASASDKKVLAMANEKKFKEKSKMEKEELSAQLSEEKSDKDKEKTEETDDMSADTAFRTELTTQCEDKAKGWDQRSKSRADELTALAEATETLKSGVESNYDANKKLVGLVAKKSVVASHIVKEGMASKKPVVLLQLGKSSDKGQTLAKRVATVLALAAKRLASTELTALVYKLDAQEDHFVKVRGLIKDLIAKLRAAALEEMDQKSFCDKSMAEAVASRDKQSLALEGAHAELVGKEAQKAELLDEIKILSEEVAELNKAFMEATELRQDEKAANAKTISMATEGKAAVESAITVLEGYYKAFVQKAAAPIVDREGKTISDLAPESSFSGEYKGNQEASKGIIGLLNVILSDFGRTETTVGEAEKDAQTAFKKFEGETKTSISDKEALVKTKEGEVEKVQQAIVDAKDAIKSATDLKATSLQELEKLSAMCVDGTESYAERKEQREKEIAALKEAITILDEWKD
mmetsp:Transcript_93352/g.302081  ORF Transcript_93352/g.302081 Transcript_93352/m.302081 type:complete len:692 (+) Transcript_93352:70-2145(+)